MPLDGKELSVAGVVIGWCCTVFGFGKAYGSLSSRIAEIEKHVERRAKNPIVTDMVCLERRSGCSSSNRLQFQHGTEQFIEVKKMISENDKAGRDRHNEIVKILVGMDKK